MPTVHDSHPYKVIFSVRWRWTLFLTLTNKNILHMLFFKFEYTISQGYSIINFFLIHLPSATYISMLGWVNILEIVDLIQTDTIYHNVALWNILFACNYPYICFQIFTNWSTYINFLQLRLLFSYLNCVTSKSQFV